MICPPQDLRPRRVMSIVASASSDANTKTIVSSSHPASFYIYLHGPPPSSLGADSLPLYIYICITLSYLQVGPPCWAPTDPMFLAFNVVCKKFLLSLSYFPVLWKKQMQQPLTHIQYSYYQYYQYYYYYYYNYLPLALFFMFLSFRGMF